MRSTLCLLQSAVLSICVASQSIAFASNSSGNNSGVEAGASNVTETDLVASPATMVLTGAGATKRLAVEASYSNGASQDITQTATYVSNSTSVATVTQTGLVTAVGDGTARVVVSYGGRSSSVNVTVNASSGTYSITGTTQIAAATVAISGASEASTKAASRGGFRFTGLAAGTYTITPSLAGYTFTPASQTASITNANVTRVIFTATPTPHVVDLKWGAGKIQNPVSGQVVIGYNVYRSPVSGGPYTQLNASPIAALHYVDDAVSAGDTLYYVCSTVDNLGNVSSYSNQATVVVP